MEKFRDLENFSDAELLGLNQAIISVIKARHRLNRDKKIRSFCRGERIVFKGPEGGLIDGEILRVNQKSLTVSTEHGTWRIDPAFVTTGGPSKKADGKVIKMQRKT